MSTWRATLSKGCNRPLYRTGRFSNPFENMGVGINKQRLKANDSKYFLIIFSPFQKSK